MKKTIIIPILTVLVVLAGLISYMVYFDIMLIRLPVLVEETPKITFVIGDGFYRENNSREWKRAIVGTALDQDYEIKTDENALIDIRFHNEMAVRIPALSKFKIDKLTVKEIMLNVQEGKMFGKFEKVFKKHSIGVKTPTAIAAVRGTELGFEVSEKIVEEEESEKDKKAKKKEKETEKEDEEKEEDVVKKEKTTTIYSLSGITELHNPAFAGQKILLSYQNKLVLDESKPPSNPEELTDEEAENIRSILNAIHPEEVLLISDKINFKSGSAKILPSSYPELDKIVAILEKRSEMIRIEGHTDSVGKDLLNHTLSIDRAASIREYFVKKGIDPKQLEISGYGESKPVANNKTEKGRALNRRVEFIIVE